MFCPKCGQQQASDAARFCSRCGLPLGGTAALLANEGVLPAPPAAATSEGGALTRRRRGVRQGGFLMLLGAILVPMIALMHPLINLPGEYAAIGVLVLLAGLLRLLYAAFFESAQPAAQQLVPQPYAPPARLDPSARRGTLPHGEFRPAPDFFAPRADTAEIAPPPSVADHTTRLLRRDDDTAQR